MLLLSVGLLELYGSWLAWTVLSPRLRDRTGADDASAYSDTFWMRFIHLIVEAINIGGLSVTGVGLLALLTAPLPLALFLYHVHLIWTGMTTNETLKWGDWRDDMVDGVVFKAKRSRVFPISHQENFQAGNSHSGGPDEVHIDWPVDSDQILVRTVNGRPPASDESQPDIWERCWRLNDVDNIYDLGFWDNLRDVLRG